MARWTPGVAVTAVAAWLMLSTGVQPEELLRFAGYWLVVLLVPGAIVHRWLRGQPSSLLAELGMAGATGLSLEVLFAYAGNLAGVDGLAPWWFLLPYAALASSHVRAAVRPRPRRDEESTGQAWAIAGVAIVVLVGLLPIFRRTALPPQDSAVNIDAWWHLGLVREMLKPGMPVDPQVAGEPLLYHWFSHLHLAIAGRLSGVDPITVGLRLWPVPVVLLILALVVVLGRTVARRFWAGPLAAWITFSAAAGGVLWASGRVTGASGAGALASSPSQALSILTTTASIIGLVAFARERQDPRQLAWLALLIAASVGMKPSAIPVMLCGTLLATVAMSVARRRPPWRLVGATGMLVVALAGSFLVSKAAGNLTLLGSLHSMWPYNQLVADGPRAMSSGILVDTLVGWRAWVAALATAGVVVVGNSLRLVGLAVTLHRDSRRDPAGWLLAGSYVSGWGAVLLVDHASRSQFYFLGLVAAFGSVLAAWLFAILLESAKRPHPDALPTHSMATPWGVMALGVLLGSNIAWIARQGLGWLPGDLGLLDRTWIPIVIGLGGLLAMSAVVRRWDTKPGRKARTALVVASAVLGLTVPGAVARAASEIGRAWAEPQPLDQGSIDYLTSQEQQAALWLGDHSDPQDVVATNVQCRPGQQTVPGCDARGFWVSALSGRRVMLGGWSYTDQAQALHGVDGRAYVHQPSPWPDRYELSHAAFTDPDADVLTAMRARGVDWLFGDRRAGKVSPEISDFAQLEFENDLVSIWRIEP